MRDGDIKDVDVDTMNVPCGAVTSVIKEGVIEKIIQEPLSRGITDEKNEQGLVLPCGYWRSPTSTAQHK